MSMNVRLPQMFRTRLCLCSPLHSSPVWSTACFSGTRLLQQPEVSTRNALRCSIYIIFTVGYDKGSPSVPGDRDGGCGGCTFPWKDYNGVTHDACTDFDGDAHWCGDTMMMMMIVMMVLPGVGRAPSGAGAGSTAGPRAPGSPSAGPPGTGSWAARRPSWGSSPGRWPWSGASNKELQTEVCEDLTI